MAKNKSRFDAREMMEKTLEVMKESVSEHREDGTPSPMVGAVLVRPGGSIEAAARGELRDGNHAVGKSGRYPFCGEAGAWSCFAHSLLGDKLR